MRANAWCPRIREKKNYYNIDLNKMKQLKNKCRLSEDTREKNDLHRESPETVGLSPTTAPAPYK